MCHVHALGAQLTRHGLCQCPLAKLGDREGCKQRACLHGIAGKIDLLIEQRLHCICTSAKGCGGTGEDDGAGAARYHDARRLLARVEAAERGDPPTTLDVLWLHAQLQHVASMHKRDGNRAFRSSIEPLAKDEALKMATERGPNSDSTVRTSAWHASALVASQSYNLMRVSSPNRPLSLLVSRDTAANRMNKDFIRICDVDRLALNWVSSESWT